MKRGHSIRIAMFVCAAIAVTAAILALTGAFGGGIGYTYENADKYTAGDADITGAIRALDIGWVDGSVDVVYHAEDRVLLRETAARPLGEDVRLRWWLDGDTLRVRYAAPGLRFSFSLDKRLTLTLPERLALDSVDISTVSGEIGLPGLKADRVTLSSVSGDQALELPGRASAVAMSSVSGGLRADIAETPELSMASTSGRISARVPVSGRIKLSTVSGAVSLGTGTAEDISLATTSGSVTAALPGTPGFTAELTTVSGRVDAAMPLSKDGNTYTCGNGEGRVRASTVSGNVRLENWHE